MKRLPVVLLCLSLVACHPPATIVTPQGKVAFTSDQIVVRINELQNAAIQANESGNLSTAAARVLVEFAVSADKTLKASPQGWQKTVATAWTQAKGRLPPYNNPAIASAINAVDVVLAAYGS